MGDRTGNPLWVDSATVQEAEANPDRMITAAKLNAIEDAIDATVATVNGVGPDSAGNVVVSGGGGPITSADISDSTATGRAVLTAADAATARSAIGAGTSNLAIGTTGSTAAAGNHNHDGVYVKPADLSTVATSGSYDDLTDKPTIPSGGVSADAGNLLTLGSDSLPMLDPDDLPAGGGGGATALGDLTDVDTTGATTGQVLTFDGSEWSPDAPSAGTVTSTSISDSTATGRAVLTAADAATARTAIGAGTSNFDGAYSSLSGKPTLGTAAAEDVGDFAAAAHSHDVDDLTATGTKSSSTFLRGDNTWATPSGGSGASVVLLGPEDPVPGGTPAGLVIRLADTP